MNSQWADNERNMARRSGECGGASFQSRDAPAPKASGCPRRSRAAKRSQEAARLGKVASFSVSPEGLCWRGQDGGAEDLTHVIRYKDVLKWLKIHRRTLDYYIQRGYLKRVYGCGETHHRRFAGQLPQVHRKAVGKMRGGMWDEG